MKTYNGSLLHCQFCGSDDLDNIFGSDSVECVECEARYHLDKPGVWLCFPNDDGRRALAAAQRDACKELA